LTSKVLAHVGLGLVTYVPLALYLVFVFAMQPDDAAEVFGSGLAGFLGFFATMMMMFGLPLLITALVISVRGLMKRRHTGINGATLTCCVAWFASAFWVMANFR
jgi:hypothetical protein